MGSTARATRHGRQAGGARPDAFFETHNWTRVPRLVQWMTTLRCPLSCPHCLAAGEGEPQTEMSLAQAARLIEEVAALGVEEFLLTGGEPLAREDLPQTVAILQANAVRWSLNTAAMPAAAAQRAMLRWPPCFVAVSLDGPAEVHDRFRGRAGARCRQRAPFREATEAIAFFAQLVPSGVAAGTTVTARNFSHLAATFATVLASGASSWGLHLVVPEGRAARRRDLRLSRRQIKELLQFAAAKRQWFPVTIADEIGYCGDWEPLVRDLPFFCGAGKAQCVVLPDGEVVPCTTLDRSASSAWPGGMSRSGAWTARSPGSGAPTSGPRSAASSPTWPRPPMPGARRSSARSSTPSCGARATSAASSPRRPGRRPRCASNKGSPQSGAGQMTP